MTSPDVVPDWLSLVGQIEEIQSIKDEIKKSRKEREAEPPLAAERIPDPDFPMDVQETSSESAGRRQNLLHPFFF